MQPEIANTSTLYCISTCVTHSIVCSKIFMLHIWMILIKIHIPVKEVQLKSMKWKISKISSLTHCHFSHEKIHRNENNFLRTFIIGNVQIIPVHFFKVIIRVFSNTKSPKHHIFSCVLKPDKLKGRFNGELLGILHTFE